MTAGTRQQTAFRLLLSRAWIVLVGGSIPGRFGIQNNPSCALLYGNGNISKRHGQIAA